MLRTAFIGSLLLTFRENVSAPSAGVKLPKKTGPAYLTLEVETDTLSRKFGNEILTACGVSEKPRSQKHSHRK